MEAGARSGSHRLLVGRERWERLRALPHNPVLERAARLLEGLCQGWASSFDFILDETVHNYHLNRARQAQSRVVSLLVHYGRTGNSRFRDAALDYIRIIAGWEYWSWIAWRDGEADPGAIFDLSYGENSLTLALAWDWLADELAPAERSLILETARERSLLTYLALNDVPDKEPSWWYRSPNCNWNTVCNGGAGTLALALGRAFPEGSRVVELAEEGIRTYFEFMQEDGAWPEGIGYWGYGHRYGYYYLLSHEHVRGGEHPLLGLPGSRNTLRFPLLFSPNGVPASFGDVNAFLPLPFHFAAAERYGMADVSAELDRRFDRLLADIEVSGRRAEGKALDGGWPMLAELLLFHPGEGVPAPDYADWPRVSIQKGVEWSFLADGWPQPSLYASVRGGTTKAPHTHQDLTSITVVVGREALLSTISGEYIDTTFSRRREELYEISAAAKNVLLVNGVGLPHRAAVATRHIAGEGWEGVLLDAGAEQDVGSPVLACGRAVLMLQGRALLVLDRVTLQHAGQAEARFHSQCRVRARGSSAHVCGDEESLHLAFAASVPAVLRRGWGLPTAYGQKPERLLRWMTRGRFQDMVMAALITPGGEGSLSLQPGPRLVEASGPGYGVTVSYSSEGLDIS